MNYIKPIIIEEKEEAPKPLSYFIMSTLYQSEIKETKNLFDLLREKKHRRMLDAQNNAGK